jgi:hypothetical protein
MATFASVAKAATVPLARSETDAQANLQGGVIAAKSVDGATAVPRQRTQSTAEADPGAGAEVVAEFDVAILVAISADADMKRRHRTDAEAGRELDFRRHVGQSKVGAAARIGEVVASEIQTRGPLPSGPAKWPSLYAMSASSISGNSSPSSIFGVEGRSANHNASLREPRQRKEGRRHIGATVNHPRNAFSSRGGAARALS